MALGVEMGLGPSHIVLDRDPAPVPKKGTDPNCLPISIVAISWMHQDATWYGDRPQPRRLCVRWVPRSPFPKRGRSHHFLAHVYRGQTAEGIKTVLGMEMSLGLGHIV